MYQVLLAVDANEERAASIAEAVAELPGGPEDLEVMILNVFEEFVAGSVDSKDLYEESELPESVSVAREILEREGISVSQRRVHGQPTETIISIADEIEADAIALAGRKRTPAGKMIFGSVTQSVLLSADRPVFVATVT